MINLLPLIGRIFIAMIFLYAGVTKLNDLNTTVMYISQEGLPYATFLAISGSCMEILGSLLVLVGYKTRFGAFVLFLFTIPATLFFHDFWTLENTQALNQMQHFMKNFAMMGGLLYIMAYGGGAFSFDKSHRE